MQGASSMCGVARDANGIFIEKYSSEKLQSSQEQIEHMTSERPLPAGSRMPELWLHFDPHDHQLSLWEGTPPPVDKSVHATLWGEEPVLTGETSAEGGRGAGDEGGGGGESSSADAVAPPPSDDSEWESVSVPVNPF